MVKTFFKKGAKFWASQLQKRPSMNIAISILVEGELNYFTLILNHSNHTLWLVESLVRRTQRGVLVFRIPPAAIYARIATGGNCLLVKAINKINIQKKIYSGLSYLNWTKLNL